VLKGRRRRGASTHVKRAPRRFTHFYPPPPPPPPPPSPPIRILKAIHYYIILFLRRLSPYTPIHDVDNARVYEYNNMGIGRRCSPVSGNGSADTILDRIVRTGCSFGSRKLFPPQCIIHIIPDAPSPSPVRITMDRSSRIIIIIIICFIFIHIYIIFRTKFMDFRVPLYIYIYVRACVCVRHDDDGSRGRNNISFL